MKNTKIAVRQSRRKRLISEFFEGEPYALSDELRWHVLRGEAMEGGRSLSIIERSQLVSFSRTVRDHCNDSNCTGLIYLVRHISGSLPDAACTEFAQWTTFCAF